MSKINLTKNFTVFLIDEVKPLIASGKATYQDIILKFKSKFGRDPEGMEAIAIRQEFAKPGSNVFDMQGNALDPNKPIMGGTQEGIPTTIEGKTKNMSADEIMDFLQPNKKGNGARPGNINYDKMGEMFPDVKLYGDESFDELLIIEKTGKHPRNKADGGRVNLQLGGLPLTEKGQNIYDSMTRAGFDEMAIAQALDEQQVAPEITTPGLQQEAVAPPRIQPILPINQGDSSGITTNINRSNPNFDYEFAALGNLANPNNVALTEEEQKQLNFQKGKDGLMSFAKGLGYAINPLGFFAKKGYDFYQNKVRDAQYQKDEADRMKKFQEEKAAALAFEEERLANTAFQNAMANPTAFYASLNDGAGATSTASSRSEAGTDDTPGTPFAKGGLATMFVRKR